MHEYIRGVLNCKSTKLLNKSRFVLHEKFRIKCFEPDEMQVQQIFRDICHAT